MKNFFDTTDEKITEKAFSQSIIISVVSILLCIVMLCSLTYAWFSEDVSSNTNKLAAGHFSVTVDSVIRNEDGGIATANEESVLPDSSGVYNLAKGTYTVTLQLTGETTVKGYCVVVIDDKEYRTEVIVNEQTKNEVYHTPNAPFTFKIKITEAEATVKIESRWGVPADPIVNKDGVITTATSQTENEGTAGE